MMCGVSAGALSPSGGLVDRAVGSAGRAGMGLLAESPVGTLPAELRLEVWARARREQLGDREEAAVLF